VISVRGLTRRDATVEFPIFSWGTLKVCHWSPPKCWRETMLSRVMGVVPLRLAVMACINGVRLVRIVIVRVTSTRRLVVSASHTIFQQASTAQPGQARVGGGCLKLRRRGGGQDFSNPWSESYPSSIFIRGSPA